MMNKKSGLAAVLALGIVAGGSGGAYAAVNESAANARPAVSSQQQYSREAADKSAGRSAGRIAQALPNLDELIAAGVIDQATADRLSEFMKQQAAERKAEMEKVKEMTAEERQAYMESRQNAGKAGCLSEAVAAGVITQAQADAIQELLPQKPADNGRGMAGRRQEQPFDLNELIAAGTIDQTTADRLSEFMKQQAAERKAEMEKVKEMTAEERQAYMESRQNAGKAGCLSEAVAAGVITQAQAEAIQELLPQKPADNGRGMAGRRQEKQEQEQEQSGSIA